MIIPVLLHCDTWYDSMLAGFSASWATREVSLLLRLLLDIVMMAPLCSSWCGVARSFLRETLSEC